MKEIIVGAVAWGIIYTISLIIKRKDIKKDWKRNSHKKELGKLDSKISEIRILNNKDIISDEDCRAKIKDLEDQKKSMKVEYYLKQNQRYITLKRSLDKGFINHDQFNTKVEEVKAQILKNVK